MKNQRTRRLVLAALFAALTCVATATLSIPSPLGGYFNLGDTVILLGAFLLGPIYGALAGGIGAALADLLLGFVIYAPATLVIKALTAPTACMIFRAFRRKTILGASIGAVAGELVMATGYFLYEWILYGIGGSVENLLMVNLPQAGINAVAALLLYIVLEKSHAAEKLVGGVKAHDR